METIRSYEHLLQKSALFTGLSSAETEEALCRMRAKIRDYPRGAFLHHTGQPMEQFGLVLSGGVNVCKDDLEGNRMLMANVGPGDTFAESLCYLRVQEIPVYMISTGDTRILWLSPHALFESGNDEFSARLRNRFTGMLARRALAMNTRIQILSKLTLREKIMTYFSSLAYESGSDCFRVPFSREDMAVYIGVNRSALSRELSRMKREGIIDYERNEFCILIKRENEE
jgi:CRP-like cAMP-binding protein